MEKVIPGVHHVTAIAGEPQPNIDFYAGTLGLRLVKLTVNFDDPTTYHLYYGDGQGHPGTILTFFPWPDAFHGQVGTGQVTVTSFAVPDGSLEFWQNHLQQRSIQCQRERSAFGEDLLALADPDGLPLELVSTGEADPDRAWGRGPVPPEHAIRGFHHVTLAEEGYERTAVLLTETMGFRLVESKGNRFRYATPAGSGSKAGTMVDVICTPSGRPGRVAVGTVHHVAWRTPTDEQQVEWHEALGARRYNVTPIIDRKYFHSIRLFHATTPKRWPPCSPVSAQKPKCSGIAAGTNWGRMMSSPHNSGSRVNDAGAEPIALLGGPSIRPGFARI